MRECKTLCLQTERWVLSTRLAWKLYRNDQTYWLACKLVIEGSFDAVDQRLVYEAVTNKS